MEISRESIRMIKSTDYQKLGIAARKKVMELNERETDSIVLPDLIQDDAKSRVILVFFILAFYMAFLTLEDNINLLERINSLTVDDIGGETEEEAQKNKAEFLEAKANFKYVILYFGVKLLIYILLTFLFGYSNSTPARRTKISVLGLAVLLAFFVFFLATDFEFELRLFFERVMLGFMVLFCLYSIITSCRRKGRIFRNFNSIKNELFYEYTFQKLFDRPSHYWLQRQKKVFRKKLQKAEEHLTPEQVDRRFEEHVRNSVATDFFELNVFKKVSLTEALQLLGADPNAHVQGPREPGHLLPAQVHGVLADFALFVHRVHGQALQHLRVCHCSV